MLASALLEHGMVGRGSAQHARALSLYPQPSLRRAVGLFRAAGLGFVTDPHTGPLHLPVRELLAAGIPVALGQDDIEDAYYPFGRHDLLEVAFLAAHLLDFRADADLELLLDMVTGNGARVLGRPVQALEPGADADLLVLRGRTAREVLTRHEPPSSVVVGGRLVASTTVTTEFTGLPQASDPSLPVRSP
jgi:cytosine/creatinine deaminase